MLSQVPRLLFAAVALLTANLPLGAEDVAPAVPDAAVIAVPDLSGHWSGSWQSCTTSHDGPMSARFCKVCENQYEVRFKGKFWGVFPFKYAVTLHVTGVEEGKVYLSGSHKLPLFGTFSYNAWATDTQFVASYCAKKDHGVFSLSRCCR